MSRIVSVWLPRWPILRFLMAQARNPQSSAPVDPAQPFVLNAEAVGGPCLTAANEAAEALGLMVGDRLTDARAKAGVYVQVRPADPAADAAALHRLALWAMRYTPMVSPWHQETGGDGFFLDVTGASHLCGGERELLADLSRRLTRLGVASRCAAAETPGAAWALSRFHPDQNLVLPGGREAEALSALPIEALRVDIETSATLRRLGFKSLSALIGKPRAPFAARFPTALLARLDQALGHMSEPLDFILPPAIYHARRQLLEPVVSQEAIVAIMARLMADLVPALTRDGVGARHLRLDLFRVDGEVSTLELGLARPSRDPSHITRLAALKLDRLVSEIDAGFGFETMLLSATGVERMEARQTSLMEEADEIDRDEREAMLIDNLVHRLGPGRVKRLAARASHLPERAAGFHAASRIATPHPKKAQPCARPLFLLPGAEPAEVLALLPDGPPKRFRWRGVTRLIAQAEGPERIAGEWWRNLEPTRDYYLAEDDAGHRFWLYREGLQGRETALSRWFVHGLFA